MPTKVYVSDLDGTLLRADLSLSPHTRESINALIRAGVGFTCATARSADKARELTAPLGLRLPIIAQNGAEVVGSDGEVILSRPMDAALVSGVIAIARREGVSSIALGRTQRGEVLVCPKPANVAEKRFVQSHHGDPRLRMADAPTPALAGAMIGLACLERVEVLRRIAERVRTDFPDKLQVGVMDDIYCPGYAVLQIQHAQASKGFAVRFLANHLGIALADMTAFGDQLNDLDMFRTVGRTVAMANADEPLKAAADFVTASNEDDGVARFILGDAEWSGVATNPHPVSAH